MNAIAAIILIVGYFTGKTDYDIEGEEIVNQETKLPEVIEPEYIVMKIPKGGSIYQLLTDMGISNTEIARFTKFMGEYVDFTSLQIGDIVKSKFREETIIDTVQVRDSIVVKTITRKILDELIYQPDVITSHILKNYGDSLNYKLDILPFETKRRVVQGTVTKSLNASLIELGFETHIRQQIIKPLESAISFETDAREGDLFEVYIEEKYYQGKLLPQAVILYASYEGKKVKKKEAFRFYDEKDDSALNGMYTPEGKALVTGAVRTPLDYMHVSSGFGNRIHPISGKWKFHQGIDYRGKTGTPVYAVANGKVVSSGVNGGYGKEVRIRHDDMVTQYAHLHQIFVKKGTTVRKGTKIGTVGTTGYSTGPHLHFGLMKKGKWINPKNLKMIGATELKNQKLEDFKIQKQTIESELDTMRSR